MGGVSQVAMLLKTPEIFGENWGDISTGNGRGL